LAFVSLHLICKKNIKNIALALEKFSILIHINIRTKKRSQKGAKKGAKPEGKGEAEK